MPPHTVRPWPLARGNSPLVTRLAEQIRMGEPTRELVDELLSAGTPLIETAEDQPGHVLVTFLWRDHPATTPPHGVLLALNKITDPLDPADTLLEPVPGAGLRALTLVFPEDWLGSYLFIPLTGELPAPVLHRPVDHDLHHRVFGVAVADPHAREYLAEKDPRPAVARGPGAPRGGLSHAPDEAVPATRRGHVRSAVNGAELAVDVWSAPGATDTSPLLVLFDGEVWHGLPGLYAGITHHVAQGTLPSLRVAFVESGGPVQRQLDYASPSREMREFFTSILDAAGATPSTPVVTAGQSMGGLLSARLATLHPDRVAAGIAQSPSFWWPSGGAFREHRGRWFRERADAIEKHRASVDPRPAPLVLQVGITEWDSADDVRHAAALLRVEGALIDFTQVCGGHDQAWWQELLLPALTRVFADEKVLTRVSAVMAQER